MAEALGVAASVVAVVQLAGSCLKLVSGKRLGSSEFGSSDLISLEVTLHGFFEAITKFETRLGAIGNPQYRQGNMEHLPRVLERCKAALDMVQRFMNKRGFIGRHVTAPKLDSMLKASMKALDAAKELFLLAMHTDNQAILLQTQQCLDHFAESSRVFQDDTTNVLKRMDQNAEERGRESKEFREDSRIFQDDMANILKRMDQNAEERGRESKGFRDDSRIFQDAVTNSLKTLEDNFQKLASTVSDVMGESGRGKQNKGFMESLRFDQHDARQAMIKNAYDETCQWVLNNRQYDDWLDSGKLSDHRGFLWIKGKPGAGKSTLMKFLLVQAKYEMMKGVAVISFFFNARGGDLEKSTIGMYRSLLFQILAQQPKLQEILRSSAMEMSDYQKWNLEHLKALFKETIRGLAGCSLVCFIDALDECDEDEIRDMLLFFQSLGALARSIEADFRVCVSSRHYPHITVERGLSLVLEGQDGHDRDISRYIETGLKIGHSELAQQVRAELQEKAQGVFMWAVLVVGILNKEHDRGNIHNLRKRLQDIPGDLHALFRSILTKDDNDRDRLLLCVQWVLFSREPLKPEQLYFAVSCEFEPDILQDWDPGTLTPANLQLSILDSSKGLVEVTRSRTQTVQFIHESVKDFFLKSNGLQEVWSDLGHDIKGKSHERLKRCCLAQIDIDVNASLTIHSPFRMASSQRVMETRHLANERFPFLEYATRNVLYHANLAETGGISQAGFLSGFQARKRKWISLNNLFKQNGARRDGKAASLLHILAALNFAVLIRTQPREKSCFESEKSRYGPPFFAALASQCEETVTALLKAEAQAQPENPPLQELVRRYSDGQGKRLILSHEFKFSRKRGTLSYAAEFGDPVLLACFLRSDQFNIESKDKGGRTPLILAAKGGHKAAVKLLLENGANTETKDGECMTALQHASQRGHENVVEFLINNGAELETKDRTRQTPLIFACQAGRDSIVKSLLGKGADIEAKDIFGRTPLMNSATQGHKGAVKLLLENGADIEASDSKGLTSLIIASEQGERDVVEILLRNNANLEAKDNTGRTPLMAASQEGNEHVVEILLGKGANIEAEDNRSWTSLMYTSVEGEERIVEILLRWGANIEAKSRAGWTPLMLASVVCRGNIIRALLKRGADIEATRDGGRTVLMLASLDGLTRSVEVLLENGANIEAEDETGHTPLMLASQNGRANAVELLVERGASIDMQNLSKYKPPWSQIALSGYQLILEKAQSQGES